MPCCSPPCCSPPCCSSAAVLLYLASRCLACHLRRRCRRRCPCSASCPPAPPASGTAAPCWGCAPPGGASPPARYAPSGSKHQQTWHARRATRHASNTDRCHTVRFIQTKILVNNIHLGAVLLTVGWSYVGNDVTHSTLLDRACACSYKNLPRYRSCRVSNTAPWRFWIMQFKKTKNNYFIFNDVNLIPIANQKLVTDQPKLYATALSLSPVLTWCWSFCCLTELTSPPTGCSRRIVSPLTAVQSISSWMVLSSWLHCSAFDSRRLLNTRTQSHTPVARNIKRAAVCILVGKFLVTFGNLFVIFGDFWRLLAIFFVTFGVYWRFLAIFGDLQKFTEICRNRRIFSITIDTFPYTMSWSALHHNRYIHLHNALLSSPSQQIHSLTPCLDQFSITIGGVDRS